MPGPSIFSTAENLQKVNDLISKMEGAINETELAQSAGIPGAAEQLKTLNEQLAAARKFKNVYFPGGVAD